MQIVDKTTGEVLGTAPVTAAGTYSVKLTTTLANGNYTLVARSSDEVGNLSFISKPFILGVKALVPRVHETQVVTTASPATRSVTTTTTTTAAPATTPVSSTTTTTTAAPATTTVTTTNVAKPGGPLNLLSE